MTLAWVLGAGGLLGAALGRTLAAGQTALYRPVAQLPWHDEAALADALERAVAGFARQAGAHADWELYWAAGVGAMGSQDSDMGMETRTLERLLQLLAREPELCARRGALALASSAGAIYAGSAAAVISEASPVAPTTPYARAKLQQEALVTGFVRACPNSHALLARITTLYGPGQALGKRQGLLSHIARSIVRQQPIQIFVPFDTIRDYIEADDAAIAAVACLRSAGAEPVCLKILGSEQPLTIAEIVATFKRVARRPPLIATSASPLAAVYARRVLFRSGVEPDCRGLQRTSLPVGVAALLASGGPSRRRRARGSSTAAGAAPSIQLGRKPSIDR
jgi:UDP-glucose 4-epimerase